MRDYLEIVRASSRSDRRDAFRLLDERAVDLFLGVGLPEGYYSDLYTVELVAGRPDWILIYRSADHAIYLRRSPGNAENLQRMIEYYRERGIPFDSRKGFSPREVIGEAPGWAIGEGMIPPGFPELAALRESDDPEERYRALDAIGNAYWLLGDYRAQIEEDTAALALRPDAREPRRRLANAYLRTRRVKEAERLARDLYQSDRSDERARALYEFVLARRYSR
jgi:tetratricopeptide (TPR) repeat protein